MAKWDIDKPDELFDAMSMGHSFEGACGVLGISKDTGYKWIKRYKDFAEAKARGDMSTLKFLEKIAIAALTGQNFKASKDDPKQVRKINVTMAIFFLKTRFHKIYGDKMKVENVEADDKKVTVQLNYAKPVKKKVTKKTKK